MTYNKDSRILIVGAGPVGLALAVELMRRGFTQLTLIDQAEGPTAPTQSKALAINNRTLQLMQPSGVTEAFLGQAFAIKNANIYWAGRRIATIPITQTLNDLPILVTLAQGNTERILLSHLDKQGLQPRWNCKFLQYAHDERGYTAQWQENSGHNHKAQFDLIVGCDGAHSAVRKQAGIGFAGQRLTGEWQLVDVRYQHGHAPKGPTAMLSGHGAMGVIPFDDDWVRVISSRGDVMAHLPWADKIIERGWQSDFHVTYRMVESFTKDGIFLCGDAAHIHSPVGGRGMNLGIEDACWLAWCLENGKLERYSPVRSIAASKVLSQTRRQTRLITGKVPFASLIIRLLLPAMIALAPIRKNAIKALSGNDTTPPSWLP